MVFDAPGLSCLGTEENVGRRARDWRHCLEHVKDELGIRCDFRDPLAGRIERVDTLALLKDRVLAALHIFYANIIFNLLESLQRVINSADQAPRITNPIPIVLAGGSAMPKGCREMFEKARRSLHAKVDIPEGTIITDEMLIAKRPGFGIKPKFIDDVIGKKAKVFIEQDDAIIKDMLWAE